MEDQTYKQIKEKLSDREWRLNNLYFIIDKTGNKVRFRLNWAQRYLLENIWFLNIILKARQLGFTTFICILFLDTALFSSNTHCGIVAHNREDSEEFFNLKIKFAWDNLPSELREELKAESDSAKKLAFSNGSSIRVGTSLRSGTFQYLLISEFGKVCAQFPKKAREIVTGALNTVHVGQFIFIESTAEGREGYFFDYCQEAQKRETEGVRPSKLQYKFFFFPWWKEPGYRLEVHDGAEFPAKLVEYFDELETKHGIVLDDRQKAWYQAKAQTQGEDMYREYPSTPEESFRASIQGAYYANQMVAIRKNGQICRVLAEPGIPVNTGWDLGIDDETAIWFHQRVATENRIVGYYENNGESLAHYVHHMMSLGYVFGAHFLPHDAEKRSLQTGKTVREKLQDLGLKNIQVIDRTTDVVASIESTRQFLLTCWFDKVRCDRGIACLDAYRKGWNDKLGAYTNRPMHNWASNGADAFRSLAAGYLYRPESTPLSPRRPVDWRAV